MSSPLYPDPDQILEYFAMMPIELKVSKQILQHPHGNAARLLLDYLMAVTKMGRTQDGWASVSQMITAGLGLDRKTRVRGLKALEELGLIELKQQGRKAYWAKLLYVPELGVRMRGLSQKERLALAEKALSAPNVTEDLIRRMRDKTEAENLTREHDEWQRTATAS